jgi:CDP-diacylglycerol--glycerol-3-phosphate 3-phosphatidyltransferase
MHSSDISVLHTPQEFYQTLLQSCQQAERRINLATLYIGTGELEQALVKYNLHDAVTST